MAVREGVGRNVEVDELLQQAQGLGGVFFRGWISHEAGEGGVGVGDGVLGFC